MKDVVCTTSNGRIVHYSTRYHDTTYRRGNWARTFCGVRSIVGKERIIGKKGECELGKGQSLCLRCEESAQYWERVKGVAE